MIHLGDIRRISGFLIDPVDLVTGGSPCQDLSVAGKRAGLSGDRSGLFREQIRVICEMRESTGGHSPRFMVWENVPGALNSNKGFDFKEVLHECVKIIEPEAPAVPVPEKGWPGAGCLYDDLGGWSVAWRIHNARFWGVPQNRRRITLICDFGGLSAAKILFESEGLPRNFTESVQTRKRTSGEPLTGAPVAVYDARGNGDGKTVGTLTGDHEGRISDYTAVIVTHGVNAGQRERGLSAMRECAHTLGVTQREAVSIANGQAHANAMHECAHALNCMHDPETVVTESAGGPSIRRLTPLECERLQGFPDGWTDVGAWIDSRGKHHRASDTPRYRALGNAIALPFWKWLLGRIYAELRTSTQAPTLGSLFDGIGGFPLCWPGRTVWASEIDEFCIAVTKNRFNGLDH